MLIFLADRKKNFKRIIMISIKQTETKSITPPQSNDNRQSGAHSEKFSSILSTQATTEHDSARHNIDKPAAQETHLVSLGTLSRKNSSVAHLLLSNPELKSKTWSIIHDLINQNKDFKQIPVGREITFNTNSGEISWKKQNTDTVSRTHTTVKPLQSTHINSENTSNKFLLGTLNTQSPTVSELLSQHPDFKSQRWNIIYSDSNKHKPFTNYKLSITF